MVLNTMSIMKKWIYSKIDEVKVLSLATPYMTKALRAQLIKGGPKCMRNCLVAKASLRLLIKSYQDMIRRLQIFRLSRI